jgi:hypothetical protein
MADQQHLDRLRQGISTWNAWMAEQSPLFQPDLSEADLSGANLNRAYLNYADLSGARLSGADLSEARLSFANLREAHLSGAHLSFAHFREADLSRADLNYADLYGADLSGADLYGADLNRADFREADLSGADLSGADFREADLNYADLRGAKVGRTIFGNVDLRTVKRLETLRHAGPSTIGTDTIVRSQGNIPEAFLCGAGLPDTFIEYARSLVQSPIEYYTCFISYSNRDSGFAERLYADLQSKGVRCWFAPEDMKTGDKIRQRIDESIRLYDKLLLVLSQHSMVSAWVEFEVEAAIAKENERKTTMLFPLRLDSSITRSTTSWATHLQRTRHITDFTYWKQHDHYQKALTRLLRDLQPGKAPKERTE